MLLYGPPGTGKTLVARQMGKFLEPTPYTCIVNGPEILSKYVGETEQNVRDLFADAERDQRKRGDKSDLHVIIFDEIDAICKTIESGRSHQASGGREYVTTDDFLNALQLSPAFGASTGDLERCRLLGMVDCGDRHKHIYQRAMLLVEQVKVSKGSPLVTCLLGGSSDSGKTALAANDSDFPYVKIISAESMIGLHESTKCALIIKIFLDACKSPLSVIILDDIERLLEYVAICPQFSNLMSQTLLVLIKLLPPKW